MEQNQEEIVNNREVTGKEEDVFENAPDLSGEDVAEMSRFVEGAAEEVVSEAEIFSQSGVEAASEKLIPTFSASSPLPFLVRPKGQSKSNPNKGKRPRTKITLDEIDGDLLMGLDTSKQNSLKLLYRLARESQQSEMFRRAKNTLLVRIEEMHDKKLLTLSECVKIFMREFVPLTISLPSLLSEQALSDILKVEIDSSFIQLMSTSKELQNTMRKAILESKNLTVCCCGYIYVHPMLSYAKHPTDSTILLGKQPYTDKMTSVKRADVIKNLNSLRYYLEILYEYYNNT